MAIVDHSKCLLIYEGTDRSQSFEFLDSLSLICGQRMSQNNYFLSSLSSCFDMPSIMIPAQRTLVGKRRLGNVIISPKRIISLLSFALRQGNSDQDIKLRLLPQMLFDSIKCCLKKRFCGRCSLNIPKCQPVFNLTAQKFNCAKSDQCLQGQQGWKLPRV